MRYIASALETAGISFELHDAHAWGTPKQELLDRIRSSNAHLFGVQLTFSEQVDDCKEIVEFIRYAHPQVNIVLGGHLPTFTPEYFLREWPSLTCIACGESEETIIHLAQYSLKRGSHLLNTIPGLAFIQDATLWRTAPPPTKNIDDISRPYRDPKDHEAYGLASVITSRGCFYHCSFCSVPQFNLNNSGLKFRPRSPMSVADEVNDLLTNYRVTHVSFIDDIFLTRSDNSRRRIRELCAEFQKRNMRFPFSIECRSDGIAHEIISSLKDVGLSRVFLGLESGSDDVLRYFQKGLTLNEHREALAILEELQMPTALGIILFHPTATPKNVLETLSFLEQHGRLRPKHLRSRMMVYPGTPIYDQMAGSTETLQPAKPVPIDYEMNADTNNLRTRLLDLSKSYSRVDVELDKAEFRISSLKGADYQKKYVELRSNERLVAETLLKLVFACLEGDAPPNDEGRISAIQDQISKL